MFAIGVLVRVRAPFNLTFPDVYPIEAQSVTGAWTIAGGVDFDPEYLELAA